MTAGTANPDDYQYVANALYQGKTVLFLAKEMPALEVVQSRLQDIGLGQFCLELHAKKASKSHVLNQFAKTLKLADEKNVPLYARTADQLMEKRKMIRTLIERLHIPAKCGKSLYELMRILEKYQDAPDSVHFDIPTAMLASEEGPGGLGTAIGNSETYRGFSWYNSVPASAAADRTKNLNGMRNSSCVRKCSSGSVVWRIFAKDVDGMKQKVGIADCDTVNFKVYISLADILSHAVIYPEYMAELLDKDHSFEDIEQAYEKTAAIQEVLRTVDSFYDREIFSEDLAYEKKKLQIAGNGDGRLARMQRSGVLRMLRKYAKDPEQVTAENLLEQLEQLMALQEQYHEWVNYLHLKRKC